MSNVLYIKSSIDTRVYEVSSDLILVKLSYRINMIYHVDTVSIDISMSTLAQA
jgi:hypothetical protein